MLILLLLAWIVQGAPAVLSLAELVTEKKPWLDIEYAPVYIGATPKDLAFGNHDLPLFPSLATNVRDVGIKFAKEIKRQLGTPSAEFEAWPVRMLGPGHLVWGFARWRKDGHSPWQWLDKNKFHFAEDDRVDMAQTFDSSNSTSYSLIFDDMLIQKGLYDVPIFSNCVWEDENTNIVGAWINVELRIKNSEKLRGKICHSIPQPSRFNGEPITFILSDINQNFFSPEIHWFDVPQPEIHPKREEVVFNNWSPYLNQNYKRDVLTIAGEELAVFPITKRRIKFSKKNAAEPGNRILDVVEYLEERYAVLGLPTFRHSWQWRNMTQVNLIVQIKGTDPSASEKPVCIADHIDTAFAGEVYDAKQKRISVPGADDNGSAVAGLLQAAEVLRKFKFRKDIWLLHLTAEEFPASSLGSAKFVSLFLKSKKDITGLLLMDMIGWKDPETGNLYQVNAGGDKKSIDIAAMLIGASLDVSPELKPIFRSRYDPRSYLYNTDGIIWEENGYPVVLANEHVNQIENLNRRCYHGMCDVVSQMDIPYATGILKAVVETAARLAK
jgi:hypothetical protein